MKKLEKLKRLHPIMHPGMCSLELVVGGSMIHAGCNCNIVRRQAPGFDAHPTKGQLDPYSVPLKDFGKIAGPGEATVLMIGERAMNHPYT
ncbi:hypothetical protein RJ639_011055 [Escallonia herrerae]|uniref:Uncharacterized protein n=1 Tax=Escallonia herrerae TaxID=1293975 RepID=A0AA88VPC8_9ASTE|nr:hypothetical protein RJ639_011055 [Escallonia herrerae]